MAGWFGLVLNLDSYPMEIPFRMAMAMVMTILINKFIN